jgi:nicotinate-nucleotide pyrophosphorylase (carboxylating)
MLQAKLPELVRTALEEDVGSGDVTAALIPETNTATAKIICRENAIIAGCGFAEEVFHQLDPNIQISWLVTDGDAVAKDQPLCELNGPARALLTAERTALNFLQTLSGTATTTRQYVDAIAHTHTRVLDTRKTIPGLRLAQKYAVSCGGGTNHRIGLFDAVLIKENHIIAAGSIANAVKSAREQFPQLKLEVEVETLDELQQAIIAHADIALLDNMTIDTMQAAVKLADNNIKLEASGNITLHNIASIAETGVDFISIGALTKHIRAIDLSMRFI